MMRARLLLPLAVALLAGCAELPRVIAPAPEVSVEPKPAPVDESARLAEQLARCRELQREDRRKIEQLSRQLRAERGKAAAMQQKIESLRQIDREMLLERETP